MTAPHAAQRGSAVRVILADAIDYAGLFPPAQLDMAGAVAEYAAYLQSSDRWALGRFVVPASRLEELVAAGHDSDEVQALGSRGGPWRLSALLGPDLDGDVATVHAFNARAATPDTEWSGRVDTVELRASTPDAIASAVKAVGQAVDCFVEIPIASDPTPLVRAIGAAGARAKVRTGGTTPDAFPASDDLVRFLAACVAERVSFKATAGLHHPLRGDYALTYVPESPRGTMYGFLNVFLAAALLRAGATVATARTMLEERSPDALHVGDDGVSWHGHRLTREQLGGARDLAMVSFGSCSFREPLDDLTTLGLR